MPADPLPKTVFAGEGRALLLQLFLTADILVDLLAAVDGLLEQSELLAVGLLLGAEGGELGRFLSLRGLLQLLHALVYLAGEALPVGGVVVVGLLYRLGLGLAQSLACLRHQALCRGHLLAGGGAEVLEALLGGCELLALFVEGVLLLHLALVETHLGLDALLVGLILGQGLAAGGADGLLGVP